jgi:hypothetical protein
MILSSTLTMGMIQVKHPRLLFPVLDKGVRAAAHSVALLYTIYISSLSTPLIR